MKRILFLILLSVLLRAVCFAGQLVEQTASGNIKAVNVTVDNDSITATTFKGAFIASDNSSGITDNVTVVVDIDNNTCTLVIKDGLITEKTCP